MVMVTAGFTSRLAFSEEPTVDTLPGATGDPADTGSLAAALRRHLDGHDLVYCVYPSWASPRIPEQLEAVRRALGTARVVRFETRLPPLGAEAFVALAAGVQRRLDDPGFAFLALTALESQIGVYAWVSSVAHLAHAEVPLHLHVRSYVSRGGFVVSLQPERWIRRRAHGLPLKLPHSGCAVIANRSADEGWVRRTLTPALAPLEITVLPPTPAGPQWWGSEQVCEVAAFPDDLDGLIAWLRQQVPVRECAWCGTTAPHGPCVLCGSAPVSVLHGGGPRPGAPA